MKRILFALLLVMPFVVNAQTPVYIKQDQAHQMRQFNGGIEGLRWFRFPVQGGHSIPAGDSLWFVRVNPNDGQLYMWNGLSWGCMTCGGTGIVDSSVFVTVTRLRDSLLRVQQTLNDSTAALRMAIAGGSADSSVFATLYRLDSVKANIRAESVKYSDTANMLNGYVRVQRFLDSISAVRSFAGTKQNQLNGTGFVKASGTTISYDNTTYVPTSRTITINGTSQDLSSNRSWTISSSADSSIFATKYGVDTAKAALRSSINGKQNLITLTTTGTSGVATFNQSTGALNIPNYANTTYTGSTSIILTSGSFQRAALTGDVTATQNSNSTTISNSAVTNAKMANMATQTFKGRNTAGSGAPEDLSVSTVRSMLSINNVDNTSDLNKPISTATQAALNLKIDSVRTSVDSIYVKSNGTWYFAGVIAAQGAGVSWGSIGGTLSAQTDLQNALSAKMNYSDTASLSSRINTKLSISDTSAMLSSYLREVDTASLSNRINAKMGYSDTVSLSNRINTKLNASDTSSLSNRINAKLSVSDTATMLNPYLRKGDTTALLAPYLRKADTASLSNRINAKMGYSDTVSLSNRINAKLSISDTSAMLGSYLRKVDTVSLSNRINLKLNIADTANMLGVYLRKADTVTLSNRINLKVNISDTSAMLSPYLRKSDTANMLNAYARQSALDDSMGIVRDSISALRADIGSGGGGGGIDTTSLSNRIDNKVTKGGDSGALSLGSTTNNNVTILQNNAAAFTFSSGNEMTFANSSQFNIAYASGRVIYNAPTRIEYRANNDNGNQMAFNGNLGIGMPNNTSAGAKFEVNGTAGGSSVIGLFRDSIAGDTLFQINNDKTIRAKGLAGTGTRMVMASPTGVFTTADTTGLWLGAGTVVTNWSGGSTGLNAATGRTSLGGTTVGQSIFTLANPSAISFIRVNANNTVTARSVSDTRTDLGGTTVGQSFFTLTNPSAITFPRINANNTVSALSASDFRTAIGAGTGSGTVTSVGLSVPTGFSVSGSPVTTSGTITLSYATGYQGYTDTEASKLSGIEAGADVTDATNVAAAGAIMDGDFSANGIMVRTSSGGYTSRTLTGTANQISVSNGDGVSGNPTLSLHSDVTTALGKANTSLQPSDTVSVLFTKSDALIIRKYVDNCTSCTLTVNDHRAILRISNSSPVTLYVPTGLQDDFEVLIEQAGAGKITVSALSGVAIGSFESAFTTKGTYATATLYATEEEDEYTLTGNLE